MIVYLWDAPGRGRSACGVSGNLTAAERAAEPWLSSGTAWTARVEAALAVMDRTLTWRYERTGFVWQARRNGHGITWEASEGPVVGGAP
jgi:hypothetical protein